MSDALFAELGEDRTWDGETPISENGVYVGISLEDYHDNTKLLDAPSVSKSSLQKMAPPDGHPKKFWAYWAHNPKRVEQEPSKFMDFGKAVHALLLGDEVFKDKFIVRPNKAPDGTAWNSNKNVCKDWLKEKADAGLTVLQTEQIEQIKRMADDAADYDLVKLGLLNGKVERSMFWKHPGTGIWLRSRPDVLPTDSGMFADLKTASSLETDFLERQNGTAGYYIAAAITRMVCRGLGIPFESYTLLYCLSKDYGDTDHRDMDNFAIDRGERVVEYCLKRVRHGLDTGEWPGARIYVRNERPLHLKNWVADQIDDVLNHADREEMDNG